MTLPHFSCLMAFLCLSRTSRVMCWSLFRGCLRRARLRRYCTAATYFYTAAHICMSPPRCVWLFASAFVLCPVAFVVLSTNHGDLANPIPTYIWSSVPRHRGLHHLLPCAPRSGLLAQIPGKHGSWWSDARHALNTLPVPVTMDWFNGPSERAV